MNNVLGLRLRVVLKVAVIGVLFCGTAVPIFSQKPKSKQEIEAQIRELDRKKQQEQTNRMKAADANSHPTGQELEAAITKYEQLLNGCAVKKSDRCADVMYTLGSLYYDRAREPMERFNNEMKEYERTGRGQEPVRPNVSYDETSEMYLRLSREYPSYPKLPEALYVLSHYCLVAGQLNTARTLLTQLVQRFPNSPRASAAQSYLNELARMDMDNNINKARPEPNHEKLDSLTSNPTSVRSRASIQRIVMQNMAALRYAYNKRLREKPGLSGKITVKFAIDEFGKVIYAQVVASTMADTELETIVVSKVKDWTFEYVDKPGDVAEVTYPFTFSQ